MSTNISRNVDHSITPDNIITWGAHHNWARQNTRVITHLWMTASGMWKWLLWCNNAKREYAWHLLARIKEPIFEWSWCDKCKHVMIFNPGKNVIIRVLYWYLITPVSQSEARISLFSQSEAWHLISRAPGRRCLWVWPVLTSRVSHEDIICCTIILRDKQ